MKTLAALILACFTVLSTASAQTSKTDASLEEVRKEAQLKPAEHLLNGTSMNYFYQMVVVSHRVLQWNAEI